MSSEADYDGKNYNEIVGLLDGSGGGTWLDLDGTGLSEVGYIRFSVADDGDVDTDLNFELDAVSINSNLVGGVVPEPTSLGLLMVGGVVLASRRRLRG